MELVEDPNLDAFKASTGGYGRITGAVAMLVFIGSIKSQVSDVHVGYVGEAAVLEATRLGLATCWTHRFFSPSKLARYVTLAYGERIVAASPIGHAVSGRSIGERLATMDKRSTVRLPAEQIATSECLSHARGMYRDLVEAARLAPSPMNRQAWRFALDEDDRLCVSLSGAAPVLGLSTRVDCGVAMLHVDVAARAAGHEGDWEFGSGSAVARWRPRITFMGDLSAQEPERLRV
jgi:nitroreductase